MSKSLKYAAIVAEWSHGFRLKKETQISLSDIFELVYSQHRQYIYWPHHQQ
jgi:hypothetical protein